MSVINKSPFLNGVLENLSELEVDNLYKCINGRGAKPIFRTLKPQGNNRLTASDKGVYPIILETKGPTAVTLQGYLIYNDSDCVLISYSDDNAQLLSLAEITVPASGTDYGFEYIDEIVSITDLRSELFDLTHTDAGGGGGGGGEGGSGTQLYEHKVLLDVAEPGSEGYYAACKIISWESASFAGRRLVWTDLIGHFISGYISLDGCEKNNPTYNNLTALIGIVNNNEPSILFLDAFGNTNLLEPNYDRDADDILSDTVTPL